MKKIFIIIMIVIPAVIFAQGMPSEQFVLYKVWAADSSALKNLGYGEYVFSSRDTVVLEGFDMDTVVFQVSNPRGYFNVWVTPDTANFNVNGSAHNHSIGTTDSLSIAYKPKLSSGSGTYNVAVALEYLKTLDWEPEGNYYESITPPLTEYLEFYIQHTGAADTSAVIIELIWQ